jgi:hypothetical protein
MQRQMLEPVGNGPVESVVGRLGAVQAQSAFAAELSVNIRRSGSRVADIAAALSDGRLIKVFAFRGATHLVTPEEGGTYLVLRAASRQWELPSWQSYYRLKPSDWPAFRAAVRDSLADGPLTLKQLGAVVTADARYGHLGDVFKSNPWTLLKALMWQGDICFHPSTVGRSTFQRLDANPRWPGLPHLDEAGPRAVEAYFRAYGPAAPAHLDYWLGQGLSAGRKRIAGWFAGLRERLAEVQVDGQSMFVMREDLDDLLATNETQTVRLLPAYDQWVLGPGTADAHVTPPAHRSLVTRGANVVIAAGVVSGTWSLREDRVAVDWFARADALPRQALVVEVGRLGQILGRDLTLQ